MWSNLSNNKDERIAFFNLLDEYFDQSNSNSTNTTTTTTISPPRFTPTSSSHSNTKTPSALTSIPTTSLSTRANNFSTTASTSIASSVLKNPTLSTAAFKQAGLNSNQANQAAKFGSTHSEILAPHLANASMGALKSGWNNKESLSNVALGKPVKGATPSGLTTSNKGMTRTLLGLKGPMSKEDAKKNVFKEPLATRANPNIYAAPSSNHLPPPPTRAFKPTQDDGLGRAVALYDYPGTESDDLPLVEGEEVTIVEHVSSDWWKCKNSQGQVGLVPTAYVKQL